MSQLNEYNTTLSERWNKQANDMKCELLLALAVSVNNKNVFCFWDNQRDKKDLARQLRSLANQLEANPDKNFSSHHLNK